MGMSADVAVVLLVEDNADNLFILVDLLKNELGVRQAYGRASGRQLFSLLESNAHLKPDLILLDLQLPRENGYTVLAQIRETPALAGVRVLAVTANITPTEVNRCQEAGFDGFIGKPIDPDRFPDQIRRALSGEAVWEPV